MPSARGRRPVRTFQPTSGRAQAGLGGGGIGITPFLSVLRTTQPGHGLTVRLHWCVRSAREAPFLDEVATLAAKLDGVEASLVDSEAGARLDPRTAASGLGNEPAAWSCWLCGP